MIFVRKSGLRQCMFIHSPPNCSLEVSVKSSVYIPVQHQFCTGASFQFPEKRVVFSSNNYYDQPMSVFIIMLCIFSLYSPGDSAGQTVPSVVREWSSPSIRPVRYKAQCTCGVPHHCNKILGGSHSRKEVGSRLEWKEGMGMDAALGATEREASEHTASAVRKQREVRAGTLLSCSLFSSLVNLRPQPMGWCWQCGSSCWPSSVQPLWT